MNFSQKLLHLAFILSLSAGAAWAGPGSPDKFAADQIKEVEISKLAGEIEIEATTQAHAWIEKIRQTCPLATTLNGNTLRIIESCAKAGACNCGRSKIKVYLPAQAKLKVKNEAGEVEVEGMQGPATFALTSGELEFKHSSAEVDATVTNGKVELSKFTGKAQVKVTNGKIDVSLLKAPRTGPLFLETTNGNIKVEGPLDMEVAAELKVTAGKVVNEFTDSKSPSAVKIVAQTVAGNIYIEKDHDD